MKTTTLFAVVLAGCSFSQGDSGDGPPIDRGAPRVEIESPVRGTIAGDVTHVLVTGTASDDSGAVASVKVNGVPAVVGDDGRWAVDVNVTPGTNLLRAIAYDANDNRGEQTRAVVAGPMVELDRYIESGIREALSSPSLVTLGHNTATFIENGGLTGIAEGMNPVVDVGTECLNAQGNVTSVTVGDAQVLSGPTDGGIMISAVLTDVHVAMHLQWSVSCVAGSRDIEMTAQRVTVQGLLTPSVVNNKIDTQFVNPNVQVVGFDPHIVDVPPTVVQRLGLDAAISPMMGSMTGKLVVPIASRLLAPLEDAHTVEVAGLPIEVKVVPTKLTFTSKGGAVELDTSARSRRDRGRFVFEPNGPRALGMTNGFELVLADDTANQLLTSLWSSQAFDRTVDLADKPIGQLYDSVELQLAVPPHVKANALPLELTIGDWMATFKGTETTTVAIHATTSLYVTVGDNGKLQLAVSTPAVRIDAPASITKAQYDAIKEFAIERVTEVGSAAVAALPLPTVGEAVPANLWVAPDSGSMIITGELGEGGL